MSSPLGQPDSFLMLEATNGYTTIEVSEPQMQAYNALKNAAERIGHNNFLSFGPTKYNRKGDRIGGYYVTPEHAAIVEAMPKVLSGEVTPEAAITMLHEPDIMKQCALPGTIAGIEL